MQDGRPAIVRGGPQWTRSPSRTAATALFVALFAGCGDQPPEQDFYVEPEMPDDPTALTNEAARAVADREELPGSSPILQVDGSGAEGVVQVSTNPSGIEVRVDVRGLAPSAEHTVFVHRGVCAEGGPVAAPLSSVQTGEDGAGSSVTDLDTGSLPPNEPLFVQLRTMTGTPVACGDLVES